MPKEYGVKEKDKVAAHLVGLLLSGGLRSNDRVDRIEIASVLGMSRIPVQEAIVQLERDGLLTSTYHHGVYVERFDADVLREHYEVFGELSGLASARAAVGAPPELLVELHAITAQMRSDPEFGEIEELGWRFRRAINHRFAGSRLRAAIRSSQTFIPRLFWIAEDDHRAIMTRYYEDEAVAIEEHDPTRSRAICVERSALMAEVAIRELERTGVLEREEHDIPDGEVAAVATTRG